MPSYKPVTMESLSMKMYLLSGVFMFLFLKIKSETILNTTITPVHSVPPPEEASSPHTTLPQTAPPHTGPHIAPHTTLPQTASPHTVPHIAPRTTLPHTAAPAVKNLSTSASYIHPVLLLNSTDKTRTTSEKLFTHIISVSGTERPTHKNTSFVTTLSVHEINPGTKSEEDKTTALPKSDSSTNLKSTAPMTSTNAPVLTSVKPLSNTSTVITEMTTMSPKPKPQTTMFSTSPISMSTTFSEKSKELTTTTSTKQTTSPSVTTVKYSQNITNGELSQSSATVTQSASVSNATNVLGNHTQTSVKTFSTTGSPVRNQSTIGTHINLTTSSSISTTSAEIPSTNVSIFMTTNATQGGWIPVVTKTSKTSTPNPTNMTTQNPTTQPCSSFKMAKECLIVIASLAAVATIFIISTIVLCTKLSGRKYKLKRKKQGTEMMCISSLLPERSNHQPVHYTRQRNPVPNGVLVIHNFEDSDDEAGDNLTLSSFLPENDRYV